MKYTIINDKESFEAFLSQLNAQQEIVYDLETNSLETHSDTIQIVGAGFGWEEGVAYYIPFNGNLSPPYILDKLSDTFLDPSIGKIGHNIKFDSRVLDRFGIKIKNIKFDTCVASYAIYGDRLSHNLDDLTLFHFNHIKIRTKSVIPNKSKSNPNPSMFDTPIEAVATYCMEDVDYCFRLYKLFKRMLAMPSMAHASKLFYEIDMPLASILLKMECNGVKISDAKIEELRVKVSEELDTIQKEIKTAFGEDIALTNCNHISRIVYDDLKLDEMMDIDVDLTSSGKKSTSASTLKKFKNDAIVDKILRYKMLVKLMNTYITAIPDFVSKHTGLVHAFFNQIGTATGRLSSNSPNLQQIPARTPLGKEIREAFISRYPDGRILSIDYSQAELRILAHMGDETVFISAFNKNEDVHTAVASDVVYNIPREQVTTEQRRTVKTVNFGLLYGMRAKKLAKELGIPLDVAEQIMEVYMSKMSGLKRFLDTARDVLRGNGYTENFFGRRRYISKIYSEDKIDIWSAEREGANNIIQSTNADIVRIAMIRIQDMLDQGNYQTKMIMQVHDELVFDVPAQETEIVVPKIKEIMESVVKFKVQMKADAKLADNWSSAH
jgi:DNA polymerase-1